MNNKLRSYIYLATPLQPCKQKVAIIRFMSTLVIISREFKLAPARRSDSPNSWQTFPCIFRTGFRSNIIIMIMQSRSCGINYHLCSGPRLTSLAAVRAQSQLSFIFFSSSEGHVLSLIPHAKVISVYYYQGQFEGFFVFKRHKQGGTRWVGKTLI